VHSPMGGQGMNTGLQDAYNLAWKLALVISGASGDALLDTYEAERRPFAQQLLATTDRAFRIVVSENWFAGLLRTRIMPRILAIAMRRPAVRRAAFMTLSQIGVKYRQSPLSQTLAGVAKSGPQAGDRFPWLRLSFSPQGPREDLFERMDDTRFHLLVIGQPTPSGASLAIGDMLRVHEIPAGGENAGALAAASVPSPSFYLVRPDGHIGLAGRRVDGDAVRRWLAAADLHLETSAPRERKAG
jgi:hypothetical protein